MLYLRNFWEITLTTAASLNKTRISFNFTPFFHNIAKNDNKLRHVCLSVRPYAWNNSAPPGRIFMKFDNRIFSEKSIQKIQVSLKSDKNNEYFTWMPVYRCDNTSPSSS